MSLTKHPFLPARFGRAVLAVLLVGGAALASGCTQTSDRMIAFERPQLALGFAEMRERRRERWSNFRERLSVGPRARQQEQVALSQFPNAPAEAAQQVAEVSPPPAPAVVRPARREISRSTVRPRPASVRRATRPTVRRAVQRPAEPAQPKVQPAAAPTAQAPAPAVAPSSPPRQLLCRNVTEAGGRVKVTCD